MYTKFFVQPGENEWIKTEVTMKPDSRSALHGTVVSPDGKALCEALVMLFLVDRAMDTLTFVSCTFTDDSGQFAFGPLDPARIYAVKVFKDSVKVRELEIMTLEP